MYKCSTCNGTGLHSHRGRGGLPDDAPCPRCKGTGVRGGHTSVETGKKTCPDCNGLKVVNVGERPHPCPTCGGRGYRDF